MKQKFRRVQDEISKLDSMMYAFQSAYLDCLQSPDPEITDRATCMFYAMIDSVKELKKDLSVMEDLYNRD